MNRGRGPGELSMGPKAISRGDSCKCGVTVFPPIMSVCTVCVCALGEACSSLDSLD